MNIEILSKSFQASKAVLGFTGWPDAGGTIEGVMAEISGLTGAKPVANWDMDGFWRADSSSRPRVHVKHGQIQKMEWPAFRFFSVDSSSSEPVLLGVGPEPTIHWRAFTRELLQLLRAWKCEEIILLGSVYEEIFHDEILISSVVQDARSYNLVREMGCMYIDYEGPSSIHSAIMEGVRDEDIHCLSFWAHTPYYIKGPHEMMMAHCLKMLEKLTGMAFKVDHLMRRWRDRENELTNLVEQNQELQMTLESIRRRNALRDASSESSKVVRLDDFIRRRFEPNLEDE